MQDLYREEVMLGSAITHFWVTVAVSELQFSTFFFCNPDKKYCRVITHTASIYEVYSSMAKLKSTMILKRGCRQRQVVQLQCYFPDDLSSPMWPTSTMGYVRSHPLSNSSPFRECACFCVCLCMLLCMCVGRREPASVLMPCILELFVGLCSTVEIVHVLVCLSVCLCERVCSED